MRRADPKLRLLLALLEAGGALGNDERGLAPVAQAGVHRGNDDMDVGDAAIGDEDLGAVQHPLIPVERRRGTEALDVGAGLGLGYGVGAKPDLATHPEALGYPPRDLLGRARRGESGGGQARA
ncbi:MAG: hypothetical protein AUG48_07110 [Actinobacteria bacterium 13_1_20CM_3_68_9]|nr:MAG: hypothetical protein AUG48_07110 [Actinobacteria bacterium 13_1_20CM_3_68_9]